MSSITTKAPARKRARVTSSKTSAASAASKKPSQCADKLAKSITALHKVAEKFADGVAAFNELRSNSVDELEDLVLTKETELEYLETEFQNQRRQRRLQVDMDVQEYGLQKCVAILAEQNKLPVDKTEFETLKRLYEELQQTHEDSVRRAVQDANDHNAQQLEAMQKTLELQKKAEVATVQAKYDAQQTQIEIYKEQIQRLTEDLSAQRELTQNVAASAANAAQSAASHGFYQTSK